jgi:hypothetical protein
LNLWTLGPVAITLVITPPKRLSMELVLLISNLRW